jgi:hypothetical protein
MEPGAERSDRNVHLTVVTATDPVNPEASGLSKAVTLAIQQHSCNHPLPLSYGRRRAGLYIA